MANFDSATIMKRGYLYDKKAGILDPKKKWFVLRQDTVMGYCILEYFKDEKSWNRREPPKGFINVRDIVEVLRVHDKKQTLELLCPGVGYRLMANSEADADDWAEAIRKLIVYRKDLRSMSFPRVVPQGGNASPLSSSPPSLTCTTATITGPLTHHALTSPPAFSTDGSHLPHQSPHHQLMHHYPTPPETIMDSTVSLTTPVLHKQGSNEGNNPYPSPPSSGDSASMCGSSTSFDSSSLNDGNEVADLLHRVPSKFKVSVNDSEKLNIVGECELIISEDTMTLANPLTGSQIAAWPLGSVRRYGVNSVCFTFESGRYCSTGEGQFFLYSPQSRLIHNKVHFAVLRKNKESRRGSAPADIATMRSGSSMIIPINRVPSVNESLSSPPQYNHIEHHLKQPQSHEMYTKLQQNSPSTFSACSTFSSFPTPEYEKLSHDSSAQLFCSNISASVPPSSKQHHTITTNSPSPAQEPMYSTLKEVEGESEVIEPAEGDDSGTVTSDDVPPPIPPRLSKMTSI